MNIRVTKGFSFTYTFGFLAFALFLGIPYIIYFLKPNPMSFVELCDMVASNVAGAEMCFMVISVYLKRRQFKDFMDLLEELKEIGR